MRRSKKSKALAFLLSLAMLITMFPAGAFAAPESGGQESTPAVGDIQQSPQTANGENGNIVVNKSVSQGQDGNYNLTLEAYATNKVDTIKTTTPLDIVLVLDTSGSMDGWKDSWKMPALKNAANSFIDEVQKQNEAIDESNKKTSNRHC